MGLAGGQFWSGITTAVATSPLITRNAWIHAFGTFAAAVLALYAAFGLQLESPGSAVATVAIVSSPIQGMVLSKGIWRFFGTVIGIIVSVLLLATLAQSPPLLIAALGVWIGIATFVASLLRYFRAYAAVLSGYTLTIVALPALDAPSHTFEIAASRLAAVTLGVVCVMVVKGLLTIRSSSRQLRPALDAALVGTAQFGAHALTGHPDLTTIRRATSEQLHALDPFILAAASESAETAQQAPAIRLFVSVMISMVSLASSVQSGLALLTDGVPAPLRRLHDGVRDYLRDIDKIDRFLSTEMGERLAALRLLGTETSTHLSESDDPETLSVLGLASRLEDVVDQLARARDLLWDIEHNRHGVSVTPVSYHRDMRLAAINGLRATLATFIIAPFWYVTAWTGGATMMTSGITVIALFSTQDQPEAGAWKFVQGVVLAIVASYLFRFEILPHAQTFGELVFCMAPFMIIGSLFSSVPSVVGTANGFLIFFTVMSTFQNVADYNIATFLNSGLATLFGALTAVIALRVLWPLDVGHIVRRMVREICRDLGRLALKRRVPRSDSIESRMHDRLARVSSRLGGSPHRLHYIEGGIAAIHMARAVIDARTALGGSGGAPRLDPTTNDVVERAWTAIGNLNKVPDEVARLLRDTEIHLLQASDASERRARYHLAAAAFREIAIEIETHLPFFRGEHPEFAPGRPR